MFGAIIYSSGQLCTVHERQSGVFFLKVSLYRSGDWAGCLYKIMSMWPRRQGITSLMVSGPCIPELLCVALGIFAHAALHTDIFSIIR